MNHAGISPSPQRVATAIRRFADESLLLDGATYKRWEARAEAVRAAAARLVGARPHEIAFVRNTSDGISLVASAISWRAGDNVVALADEYPSNVYPWFGLERFGVTTRLVPRPGLRFAAADLAELIDERTRAVAVSAVDWQSGFRADLASIATLCRRRRALLVVDAIQALGALQVDVAASGVDVLAAGGHKWLLAPEGCGVLFVSDRVLDQLQPLVLGWKSVVDVGSYLPYRFELRPDATRFEAGSADHLGIHALGAALDLLLDAGPAAIEARVLEITAELAAGLAHLGATVLSPRAAASECSSIVTFAAGDTAALHAALTRAGVMVRARLGGIRLAPHFYNDAGDIERVLGVVRDHLRGTTSG
jgi:cysteine desulfurase/selenocysteine lyase